MSPTAKKIIIHSLRIIARLILWKYKPRIIAITGSVGKTSAKDAVGAAMSRFTDTRTAQKSYNSEFGVPLTIIGADTGWGNYLSWLRIFLKGLSFVIFPREYPEWLVLEYALGKPGDIAYLTSWAPPHVAVVTSFGGKSPVHAEFFPSRDYIVQEKMNIVKCAQPDALIIGNFDEDEVRDQTRSTKRDVRGYGFNEGAHVRALSYQVIYEDKRDTALPIGMRLTIQIEGKKYAVDLPSVLGPGHAYATLCAMTVAHVLGFDLNETAYALSRHKSPPSRMNLLRGVKDSLIIDDCYNASPIATQAALYTLEELNARGRKICMLGDHSELGAVSVDEHIAIGQLAAKVCSILVTVGIRADDIAKGARSAGMAESKIFQFADAQNAGKFVETEIKKGDIVLIKGSQSTRMDRAVVEIMGEPDRASELVVRQEQFWKK